MLSSHLRFYRSPVGACLLISLAIWTSLAWYLKVEQTGLHERDLAFADAIYHGRLADTPAYPMWGYPLVLGLVDNGIVVLQLAILVLLLPLIVDHVDEFFQSRNSRLSRAGLTVGIAVCLMPWFYLTLSYNSSAMLSLMLTAAYVSLLGLDAKGTRPKLFAVSGLLLGLAFNFRTEALLVTLAAAAVMGLAFLIDGLTWKQGRALAMFLGCFAVCVTPYLIYTKIAVGTPLLSTTNGGAVLYDQLGILPNNPWHIEPTDEFAEEQARTFTDQGAWSLEADREFKKRFFAAVAAHPKAFAMRAIMGLKENLMMGLMLPRVEELLNMDEKEGMKVYLARQLMKNSVGLRMNRNEIERAASLGVEMKDIGLRDRVMVWCEFVARTFYVSLWAALLAAWPIGLLRRGLFSWNTLISSAYLGVLMVISMFIQTGMRPSTTFLPAALVFALQAHASLFDRRRVNTKSTSECLPSPVPASGIAA